MARFQRLKRHGSGDSFARLCDVLADARRYLAKRGIPDARILHIDTTARPILHLAYKEALERLDDWVYIGASESVCQYGVMLRGFTLVWENPRQIQPTSQYQVRAETHAKVMNIIERAMERSP